jgi:three-Cys-motif partner protein
MDKADSQIPRKINKWLCHKLECFGDFVKAYSAGNPKCYLEPFAGCGLCTCKDTDCIVDGTELRALKNDFLKCIFIARDSRDAANLKKLAARIKTESNIINGNCISEKVIRRAFDLIPRSAAGLAFVDPPGYNRLRWSTIRKLAAHGKDWNSHKADMLIVFPLEMALLRNLTRPDCEASINRLYGNQEWQAVRQKRLDNKIGHSEARKQLVALFKAGLKGLGYRYVDDVRPARFSNPPNYHLIWASDSSSRAEQLADIWSKARYLPCELFGNTGKK